MIVEKAEIELDSARRAQKRWVLRTMVERLHIIAVARRSLAEDLDTFAKAVTEVRGVSETEALVTEVMPLLEAMRYVERNARRVLRVRKMSRWGGPTWLMSSSTNVERVPHGLVLIIAPSSGARPQ